MDNIVYRLARDSRTPYNKRASAVGITPSAAKKRINKTISNGVIRRFARGTYYKYVSYRLKTR